ncbi:MAG: hypothetical protein Aurels2KO_24900 [Aureliella sp.]
MPNRTNFVVACPACARKLDVRVELLGRDVECLHCGANFNSSSTADRPNDDAAIDRILARAEEYVESALPVVPKATT